MGWYAANTQPHREFFAAEQLQAQDFTTFLPASKRIVRHARRVSEVRRAYFPGYVFVRLDPDRQPWRSVNGTRGVRRLVGSAERPAQIPEGFVEALMGQADAEGLMQFGETLAFGDRVRVAHGPFADLIGVVSALPDGDRVRVLLDLMTSSSPIDLPRAYCARVSE